MMTSPRRAGAVGWLRRPYAKESARCLVCARVRVVPESKSIKALADAGYPPMVSGSLGGEKKRRLKIDVVRTGTEGTGEV